jgi:hypothetical protein
MHIRAFKVMLILSNTIDYISRKWRAKCVQARDSTGGERLGVTDDDDVEGEPGEGGHDHVMVNELTRNASPPILWRRHRSAFKHFRCGEEWTLPEVESSD